MADPVSAGVMVATAVLGAAATFTAAAFSTFVPLTVTGLHKAYQRYKQKQHSEQRVVVVQAPDGQLIMVPYNDPRLKPGWQHEPQYYAQYLSPGAVPGLPYYHQQPQYFILGGAQYTSLAQQQVNYQFVPVPQGQQYFQQVPQQLNPMSAMPSSNFIVQQQTPVRPAALIDFPIQNQIEYPVQDPRGFPVQYEEQPRRRLRNAPSRMFRYLLH